ISQTISEPVMTAGDGHAVVIIVRTHHAENAGFLNCGFEWRQENILDLVWGGLRIGSGLTFARTLGDAVNSEVFRGRRNLIILLHRFRHLHAETRNQIWILAV